MFARTCTILKTGEQRNNGHPAVPVEVAACYRLQARRKLSDEPAIANDTETAAGGLSWNGTHRCARGRTGEARCGDQRQVGTVRRRGYQAPRLYARGGKSQARMLVLH